MIKKRGKATRLISIFKLYYENLSMLMIMVLIFRFHIPYSHEFIFSFPTKFILEMHYKFCVWYQVVGYGFHVVNEIMDRVYEHILALLMKII